MKFADIIIPHHNRHDHLKNCLECICLDYFNIIIVAGGSFAENCNKGAKIATAKDLIFLNDDTLPTNDILLEMATRKDDIVGIAQEMSDRAGTVYGITFKNGKDDFAYTPQEVDIPSGFCFKIRHKAWKELGGFDERFKNGGEDTDLFLRAYAHYTFSYLKNPIKHEHSQSKGRFDSLSENRLLLNKLWTQEKINITLKNKKKT